MNLQSPISKIQFLNSNLQFPGRVALQQRVLPVYRAAFFDLLAQSCEGGLSVFAGQPLAIEGIPSAKGLEIAQHSLAENKHFGDPSSKYYLCWQKGITKWLEEADPDALILEANPRYLSNRLAIRWMRERGRPVLGWGLGAPPLGGYLAPIRNWSRLTYLHTLDSIIAYSQRGAEEYITLGIPNDKVFVATNAAMPRSTEAYTNRLKTATHPLTVLFVGRLQERKRVDILLGACAALPQEIKPRLVIVGEGPARSIFEERAAQIYPQAEFVGAKFGIEMQPYFEMADLFALPGTGGLAVQQAMSYALPVIVAKGDGTQDDLVRSDNGWQVPPGDQEAFTNTLHEALSDIRRLRRMGEESYRIVVDEINLESMVSAFVDALNTMKKI